MIKTIFKQIWNQRRTNAWIFLELLIAGFFLWTVIDPVYVLTVRHLMPKGYEEEGRYILNVGAYMPGHAMRDTTITGDQIKEGYLRLARLVKDCPEVESICIVNNASFPNAGSWNGNQFYPDTASVTADRYVPVQHYETFVDEGSDIFRTYGIKDVHTGKDLVLPEDAHAKVRCYLSEHLALELFGTTNVVGRQVYDGQKNGFEVGGVFKNLKHRDFENYYNLSIKVSPTVWFWVSANLHLGNAIIFRLKEGVDFDAFNTRFKAEVAPHMQTANFYFNGFQPFKEARQANAEMRGVYNKLRLQYSLAAFALLCIFLGMVGTFWVRCNARRQEIGLMRSLGASVGKVRFQFYGEAALLVSMAFVCILPALAHVAKVNGMYGGSTISPNLVENLITNWWTESIPHFLMVSLLTYLLLLAVAVIGTAIPVSRAAKVLPADALRDE